jgi:hypothetical protein
MQHCRSDYWFSGGGEQYLSVSEWIPDCLQMCAEVCDVLPALKTDRPAEQLKSPLRCSLQFKARSRCGSAGCRSQCKCCRKAGCHVRNSTGKRSYFPANSMGGEWKLAPAYFNLCAGGPRGTRCLTQAGGSGGWRTDVWIMSFCNRGSECG